MKKTPLVSVPDEGGLQTAFPSALLLRQPACGRDGDTRVGLAAESRVLLQMGNNRHFTLLAASTPTGGWVCHFASPQRL